MNFTKSALIGHSGFVGTTLQKQAHFGAKYRSTDIADIRGQSFDLVVCAGAPAQKWLANRAPDEDLAKIQGLIAHLEAVRCQTFVLISTVDVFQSPVGVTEESPVDEKGLHPYGLHRRLLEKFVAQRFAQHFIVRLPGLVGPGLRKNVLFDLLHDNNLQAVESRNVFQFYPMVQLWHDVQAALRLGLRCVHLTAEPIQVSEAAEEGFGRPFTQEQAAPLVRYDMQTLHATALGGQGRYTYSRRESLQAIRAYAQSETRTV